MYESVFEKVRERESECVCMHYKNMPLPQSGKTNEIYNPKVISKIECTYSVDDYQHVKDYLLFVYYYL